MTAGGGRIDALLESVKCIKIVAGEEWPTLLQQFMKLLLNLTIYKCTSKCSTFLVASPCFYYYFIIIIL